LLRSSYASLLSNPHIRAVWRVNRVYWYCLLGILTWVMLRGLGIKSAYYALRPRPDPIDPPVYLLWFMIVMVLAITNLAMRSWAGVRKEQHTLEPSFYYALGWVFVSVEMCLIVAGLRLTGDIFSSLWLISFVVVVGETLMAKREEALIIRWVACTAIVMGTAPAFVPDMATVFAYVLEMLPRLGFLIAVSSVTRRLRENADTRNGELAHLKMEIAQNTERARLAREIHDGVGNTLAASVLRMELAARQLEKANAPEKTVQMLEEEAQILREAMGTVRDWAFYHRPWSSGMGEGILASQVLKNGAERLARRTGLILTITGAEILDTSVPSIQQTLWQIVQEALTNTAKYTPESTKVSVVITQTTGWIQVIIEDNGPGFDVATAGRGVGLSAMQEQAQALQGTLTIESTPQKGTLTIESTPQTGVRITTRLPC
jgi:signal transduction histidine kinase